jgi:hypothetical protein
MSNPLSSIVSITKPISGVYSIDFQCKIKEFEKLSQVIASDLEHLENPEDDDMWLNQLIDIKLQVKNVNLGISMPHVSGEVRTSFFLACQNCLQTIIKKIELPINLIYVTVIEKMTVIINMITGKYLAIALVCTI